MVRKIFTSGWTYLIIAIIYAIWILFIEAYNVWGENIFSFLGPDGANIAKLAVFFILAIIAMVIPNLKLYRTENSRPNIIPYVQPFKLEKPFYLIVDNKATDTILERYYFMICNRKGRSKYNTVDTDSVHAIIDFYDDKKIRLDSISHEQPFWLGSLPPWERSSSHNTYIKASEKPEMSGLDYEVLGTVLLARGDRQAALVSWATALTKIDDEQQKHAIQKLIDA